MTKRQMTEIAKQEIREWVGVPNGLALIILFCFIHRVCEGKTVEETFFKKCEPAIDFEI